MSTTTTSTVSPVQIPVCFRLFHPSFIKKGSEKTSTFCFLSSRRGDTSPTLERATKFNHPTALESDQVSVQYYRRYDNDVPQYYHLCAPDFPQYGSCTSLDDCKDLGGDELQHSYQSAALTQEVRTRSPCLSIFTCETSSSSSVYKRLLHKRVSSL